MISQGLPLRKHPRLSGMLPTYQPIDNSIVAPAAEYNNDVGGGAPEVGDLDYKGPRDMQRRGGQGYNRVFGC